VKRSEVTELHYIVPLATLDSIASYGLLCNELAARVPHVSVASDEVQAIRATKRVPGGGLRLHQYVNLYFSARNPMMFVLKARGTVPLVVLRVSPSVLDFTGAIIADGNAACGPTRFAPSPQGLEMLDYSLVYARSWNDPDYWEKARRKRIRCAEVLIPTRIPVDYVKGVIVERVTDVSDCRRCGWSGEVNADVFFR
jgi:hypothetical protein